MALAARPPVPESKTSEDWIQELKAESLFLVWRDLDEASAAALRNAKDSRSRRCGRDCVMWFFLRSRNAQLVDLCVSSQRSLRDSPPSLCRAIIVRAMRLEDLVHLTSVDVEFDSEDAAEAADVAYSDGRRVQVLVEAYSQLHAFALAEGLSDAQVSTLFSILASTLSFACFGGAVAAGPASPAVEPRESAPPSAGQVYEIGRAHV